MLRSKKNEDGAALEYEKKALSDVPGEKCQKIQVFLKYFVNTFHIKQRMEKSHILRVLHDTK